MLLGADETHHEDTKISFSGHGFKEEISWELPEVVAEEDLLDLGEQCALVSLAFLFFSHFLGFLASFMTHISRRDPLAWVWHARSFLEAKRTKAEHQVEGSVSGKWLCPHEGTDHPPTQISEHDPISKRTSTSSLSCKHISSFFDTSHKSKSRNKHV